MNELILPLIVGSTARWLVYTFLLWAMIKIQKIQYNALGLLACSGAAVLATFIPVVGPYASYPVLLLGLWRATRASLAPDLLFTVAIAGALMFCVDLWAMGVVMGKLGFSQENMLVASAAELDPAEPELVEAGSETAPAGTAPVRAGESGAGTGGEALDPPKPAVQRMRVHPAGIVVKGVALSAARPMAMLEANMRIFTVCPGEGFIFSTREGPIQVRCQKIERSFVLLELNGKEQVELLLE